MTETVLDSHLGTETRTPYKKGDYGSNNSTDVITNSVSFVSPLEKLLVNGRSILESYFGSEESAKFKKQ